MMLQLQQPGTHCANFPHLLNISRSAEKKLAYLKETKTSSVFHLIMAEMCYELEEGEQNASEEIKMIILEKSREKDKEGASKMT